MRWEGACTWAARGPAPTPSRPPRADSKCAIRSGGPRATSRTGRWGRGAVSLQARGSLERLNAASIDASNMGGGAASAPVHKGQDRPCAAIRPRGLPPRDPWLPSGPASTVVPASATMPRTLQTPGGRLPSAGMGRWVMPSSSTWPLASHVARRRLQRLMLGRVMRKKVNPEFGRAGRGRAMSGRPCWRGDRNMPIGAKFLECPGRGSQITR